MPTVDTARARAAILARLWGAAAREALPGVKARDATDATLTITTHSGHTLTGPRAAAELFADPGPGLAITVAPPPGTSAAHANPDAGLEPAGGHPPLTDGARGREPADTTSLAARQNQAADHAARPLTDPAELAALLAEGSAHAERLAREIAESVAGLAAARAAATPHPDAAKLWDTARDHHPDPSVYFEQLVVDGHPVHPLCRARDGVDAARFAPEHHPTVALAMTPIAPARVTGDWPWHDDQHRPLLPVHPLQAHRHRPPNPAARTLDASPLMSLRTLAPAAHPGIHIKTALDVQMTSARRRVSPASVHNGPPLSRAVAALGEVLVQRETGAAALVVDGHASQHLAAIVRQSPAAVIPDGHIAIPLAALAEPDPATTRPLIATVIHASGLDPHTWWQRFADTLLPPLLRLATIGIGLEAHGQNTLLSVHNGQPSAVVYRDFGGVRVRESTLPALGLDDLAGDLGTTDPDVVHTKLIAAAYSVTLNQLVDALTRAHPGTWWRAIAATTAAHTRDDPALREALFAATWPIKATTAMRLSDDPTDDQWTHIPNPIAGME
ncbi:IucA/IucC family protein [Stackebrandtia nassauensis]|uniref:IucA/IucC family protein n=1 Tax=Stackebrandtia nassauensis (strain DSM 44728 / CIP 108903 / NRRL B-16338 / NBRC 102104 / LLR-40K-21) TaxID=446470 RepID=D3PXR0_STANL|nr:IucA/IucC family protein [Stackebrandtia nassauensis]ADD43390.1 IucA/IucC family protein [Stackebrandtia nassauensis DSM 44728]